MLAVYAKEANFENPPASVVAGERREPVVQDASGGMATALIQMGRAAGFKV